MVRPIGETQQSQQVVSKMFSSTGTSELPQKSLQIKQDDRFFSKLMSKETSIANPSFRVYYGGVSVAVPFVWESQPGTPKHPLSESNLPPLTPPPSYYTNSNKKPMKKNSRSNLLQMLSTRINFKKTENATLPSPSSPSTLSPTLSSSSWTSLNVLLSTTRKHHDRHTRFSSCGSLLDSRAAEDDQEATIESTTSTLCFGVNRTRSKGGLGRCHGW